MLKEIGELRMKKGTISLGVRDQMYEGLWRFDGKEIHFSFSRPLPAPYNSKRVSLPVKKFEAMLPYELGGQMVNRMMK